jgi:FlaA1/EpsC-like NDP-sugar epimerase
MSIHQAVQLVFKSTQLMKNREIFVLKMPAVKLKELTQSIIEVFQKKNNLRKDISVKIIGKFGGERMHEKLLTLEESKGALELKDMFIILPSLLDPDSGYVSTGAKSYGRSKRAKVGDYSSKDVKKMPVVAIKKLLISNNDLNFDQ